MANIVGKDTRLFGLPYQFLDSVDKRADDISPKLGRKFWQNIVMDAPIIEIIPGEPKYLPTSGDKNTLTQAIIAAGISGDGSPLLQALGKSTGDTFKYYGFKRNCTDYMNYVNVLCRTIAEFLDLGSYTIDGTSLTSYDWRNYRWGNTVPIPGNLLEKYMSGDNDTSYIQFYIDPDVSANESMSNATGESKIKSIFETGSEYMKEVAFIANTGGVSGTLDGLEGFIDSSMQMLADAISGPGLISTSVLSRALSLSSNVVKGENVIMPDIYQSSSYDKSYTFTIHLKTPYGSKYAYYKDILVPLMHILALGLPKQTTANTYGAPFLVKAYVDGCFNCDLGMVTSISINKNVNDTVVNSLGVPTEMDVSVTITDLYSDLSISSGSDPILFINNSSLIEYLATTCGISLIRPNLRAKFNSMVSTISNSFTDIPANIKETVNENVNEWLMDWFGLGS